MNDKSTIKFGTDGWRGIVAEDFTFENVGVVSKAIGQYIKENGKNNKLVVGHDARFLGEEFAASAADIFEQMGIKPYLFERPMPTPMTAFAIKALNASGAVLFTASHNPPEYQGIKFIADYSGPADTEITAEIEKGIDQIISIEGEKSEKREIISVEDQYWQELSTLVDFELIRSANLKIGLDPMYGAGVGFLSEWLKHLSSDIFTLHDYFDPNFGGHNPDPSEQGLLDLAADVVATGADIGLALDGDGDRFGIIDSKGVYFSPNQVISLLAYYLLSKRELKGVIARTVATTHLIDDIAEDLGTKVVETPVGFKWICKEMRSADVVIGGEESGGLSIKGHIPEKDGILACLLVLEMIAAFDSKPLSTIMDELHDKYGRRYGIRLDLHLSEERKREVLDRFKTDPPREIEGVDVKEVKNVDGIKLILADKDWLLIRPSGTEPLIRVYIESTSPARFSILENFAEKTVK